MLTCGLPPKVGCSRRAAQDSSAGPDWRLNLGDKSELSHLAGSSARGYSCTPPHGLRQGGPLATSWQLSLVAANDTAVLSLLPGNSIKSVTQHFAEESFTAGTHPPSSFWSETAVPGHVKMQTAALPGVQQHDTHDISSRRLANIWSLCTGALAAAASSQQSEDSFQQRPDTLRSPNLWHETPPEFLPSPGL